MRTRILLTLALFSSFLVMGTAAQAREVSTRVLILGSTVSGGASSIEAQAVLDMGLTPVIADASIWAAHSAADFADYRGIILGDATCGGSATAAESNALTWGPVVDGNVLLVGTDPVFHSGQGGAILTQKGIQFALADPSATGLYATLSCYYHDTASGTAVPMLDGLVPGGFTVTGVGCFNDSHIVASHPALDGLTDGDLSNWSCSVHEAFDRWPASFQVIALARNFGSSFTASDGTVGTPYILARGSGLKTFPLSVSPTSASPTVGSNHSVVAELLDGSTREPIVGAIIRATASRASGVSIAEPLRCGVTDPCTTGLDGTVTFTYSSTEVRDDVIDVWFDQNNDGFPNLGEPQVRASVSWQASGDIVKTVILGDSYSSGEGTYSYTLDQPCHRSDLSWGGLLDIMSPTIEVVANYACSGAKIGDLHENDYRGHAPQLEQLEALVRSGQEVDMVLFTIGGNDAGFGTVIGDCFYKDCARGRAANPGPHADSIKSRIETNILPELSRIAPNATVVLVGYPRLFPASHSDTTNCGWLEPNERVAVNGAVAAITVRGFWLEEDTDAYFISSLDALSGHELCTADSYLNPVFGRPTGNPEQAHPNSIGYLAWARHVREGLIDKGLVEN